MAPNGDHAPNTGSLAFDVALGLGRVVRQTRRELDNSESVDPAFNRFIRNLEEMLSHHVWTARHE